MGSLRELSKWQRIKRRICLWSGSYTHPDEFIEFDFEAAAGIDPDDNAVLREAKFKQHYSKQRSPQGVVAACLVGFSMFLLAQLFDVLF